MEIIDKNKVGKEERFYTEANEMLEDLVKKKQEIMFKKFIPDEGTLNYLKTFRKGLYNREGKSKGGEFAVVATFPEAVHIAMTNMYGNGWYDKPGILQEFIRNNPQFAMGKPMTGLKGGLGTLEMGGNAADAKV